MRINHRVQYRLLSVLVGFLVLAGCAARQPGEPTQPGFNLYSPQDDIELGRQAAAEVRKQVDVVDNQALQNYVSLVGERLASQPAAGDYPYSFTLINDDSINAFALPGGPIFIHSGLLEAADLEAQFAGVLAHEISHVVLRHGTNQASKANLAQLPAVLAGTVIGDGGALAQLGQVGIGFGLNALILKYSRDAERQADARGARLMIQAGYDPLAMASFFEKLEEEGGPRPPTFLSSHPSPGNRVEQVRAEVRALPSGGEYNAGTGKFQRAQQLVAQLPPPNPPQAPTQRTSPPTPSVAGFETLETGAYQVAYPGEWQTYADGSTQTVTIAPQGGLVRSSNGRVAIGYGAVLSYYKPQTRNTSLFRATNELLQRFQNTNSAFRVAGQQQEVTVDGSQGLLTPLTSQSPYGGTESDVLVTVARPEGLFYAMFVAPDGQYDRARPAFERMMNTIYFR